MRTIIDIDHRLLSAAMRAMLGLRGTVHWEGEPDTWRMKKVQSGLKVAKGG